VSTVLSRSALELRAVRKSFGPVEILRGVDLDIRSGERHAIIGPNGAGKSTLFNVVTGRTSISDGKVLLRGDDITGLAPERIARAALARSFQITSIFPNLSVFDNVRTAVLWRYGRGYSLFRRAGSMRDVTQRCEEILLDSGLAQRRNVPAGQLSYAEQRALEVALIVASEADVLLLDEPTAGMNHAEIDTAIAMLRRVSEGRTLVIVEHDMNVVFQLADRITVLVHGKVLATDVPQAIRANPAVKRAYLGEDAA
jgi:branched-chain amino acid transport system ATP-binding protein